MTRPPAPDAEQIARLRSQLAELDPALARIEPVTPRFEWRKREPGFASLVRIIAFQQISTAAAAAIWTRVQAGLGEVTPEAVRDAGPDGLRALGLSSPKAGSLSRLAAVVADGFDFDAVARAGDEAALGLLLALPGVGPWTAQNYLIVCEGRMDLFPAGDAALQEAIRRLDDLPDRPGPDAAAARALAWSPLRTAAAHLLWAWYGAGRGVSKMTPSR